MSASLTIHPLLPFPEVAAGNDLAALVADAMRRDAQPGDILVVTQKIVSKAEGRRRDLADIVPDGEAQALAARTGKDPRLVALVLAESAGVVRASPGVLITRHRSGHVMANAGIDRSNMGAVGAGETVLLLPEDADRSAARLSATLERALGWPVPVVISDSFGRPWRIGVTNVAIGVAGMAAVHDHRGEPDRDGRTMEVTQVAIADLVAAAAGLAMGEGAEGVPAVLVRGAVWRPDAAGTGTGTGAAALVRSAAEDLFR